MDSFSQVNHDALLCALILVPEAFSRNRFFGLFQDSERARVRRRAARVRSVIKQILGGKHPPAEILGEAILEDGRLLLRFTIPTVGLNRSVVLSALEAASLRYALHRAGRTQALPADREVVERALAKLAEHVPLARSKE